MAKRNFKLKLSRVIPSFQLCRSKKDSSLPENSVHRLSPVNPKAIDIGFPTLPAPPPTTPDYSFIKRLSPKIASSVSCGCKAKSSTQFFSPEPSFESPDCSWKKEATRLQIVTKAQNSKLPWKNDDDATSFSEESNGDIASIVLSKYKVKKKNSEKTKMEKVKAIKSVSSRESGCFSSEETGNEETETLISTSMSFSDDSSIEFEHPIEKKVNTSKKLIRLRSFGSRKYRGSKSSSENEGSMLRRMTPGAAAEGKVKESVAVVTKSEDPYEDFKRSMLEMILEKQMFEAKDLEQLLQCFLSLNSRQYHEIIVEAFTEIWEALFCDYPMNVM
ncbi:hypothetical protein CCACVL1_08890 [Corchorus capsularis]|uniref:Transcription repressor n=1 Tax=Corchorus capsularis TaxID=210143 RepID=A0A1R3IYC9_COCAP|nr:hypothetical protein CCACVL1_08890 [Corchorus capsularis]